MASDSSKKRRGLGRGLGALIVDTQGHDPAGEEVPAPAGSQEIQTLSLDRIQPNPQQPRTNFDPDALAELADSIRAHGIIQPLIITENPAQPEHYWLVAGERRWRAARLAELAQVPVIVREASQQQLVEWALVENVQRADLNPLEEASAYQALIDNFNLTQAEIAERVGKSRSAVANTLRLLQLPSLLQALLVDGKISAGHARALLALPDETAMAAAAEKIVSADLNVRQTEELVKRMLAAIAAGVDPDPPVKEDPVDDTHIAFLEDRFRTALGTRVNLRRNSDGSGRLVVHFFNDEDLDHLYRTIAGFEPE